VNLNILFQGKESLDIRAVMVNHEPITARSYGQTFLSNVLQDSLSIALDSFLFE
jgi:hypothetical protein